MNSTLPADGGKYAELRAEVDVLKTMLDRPDAQPALVEGRMKSLHRLFDGAAAELRAGMLLSEIGGMPGLD